MTVEQVTVKRKNTLTMNGNMFTQVHVWIQLWTREFQGHWHHDHHHRHLQVFLSLLKWTANCFSSQHELTLGLVATESSQAGTRP